MADMEQYAALVDLESVIKELAKTTGRPVAIVYDPRGGWCLSDEVRKGPSKHGAECPDYSVQTYQDWFSKTIGEAALVAFGIRFLPGTLVGRLFKKGGAPQGIAPGNLGAGGAGQHAHAPGDVRRQQNDQQRLQPGMPVRNQPGTPAATRSALPLPKASRQAGAKVSVSRAEQAQSMGGQDHRKQEAARTRSSEVKGPAQPQSNRFGGYRGPGNRG